MLTYVWLEKTNPRFQNIAGKDFRQSGDFCAGILPAFCGAWRKRRIAGVVSASGRLPASARKGLDGWNALRTSRAWKRERPSRGAERFRGVANGPGNRRCAAFLTRGEASRFEFLFTSGEENRRTHGDGADNAYPQNPLWPPSILPYKGRRRNSGGPHL